MKSLETQGCILSTVATNTLELVLFATTLISDHHNYYTLYNAIVYIILFYVYFIILFFHGEKIALVIHGLFSHNNGDSSFVFLL